MCDASAAATLDKLTASWLVAAITATMCDASATSTLDKLTAPWLFAALTPTMSHASAAAFVPLDATLDSAEQGHRLEWGSVASMPILP